MSVERTSDDESRYSVTISNTPLETLERYVSKQYVSKRVEVLVQQWLSEDDCIVGQ